MQAAALGRPLWQGEAGAVFPDHLQLHGLRAEGRQVVTALPGKPGDPQPPELRPGQNPGGLTPQRLLILVGLGAVFGVASSLLGLPWWAQMGLGLALALAYLAWPAVRQVQAIGQWAQREEAVTLVLSGEGEGVVVRSVHPGDSPATLAEGGRGVALVVYGLPQQDRVQLVRQVLGYQAMRGGRR
ncbi:hypothetical protein GCM10017783_02210 [Deinococcus piscis]|uniref:DUF2244 domain-containing protein n=2 Tax=Deinococcus piscis TaxID=394230 RepID=A0ABQ3K0Q3_9DEIO|nr:hypothetical protein GCM10017783_02210 [Deinococcus piscis]